MINDKHEKKLEEQKQKELRKLERERKREEKLKQKELQRRKFLIHNVIYNNFGVFIYCIFHFYSYLCIF